MDKNTVLVVMPIYNAEKTLRWAIDSVLNQTYNNFHLVLVDDASTDGSLDIAKEYNRNPKVTLVRNTENRGAYYSRNIGLYKFRRETWGYFTTHDSDDVSNPDRFDMMVRTLRNNRTSGVQDTWSRVQLSNRKPIKVHLTCAHAMFKRSVFDRLGYFDMRRFGADWELWARLTMYNKTMSYITRSIKTVMGNSYVAKTNLTQLIPEGGELRTQYTEDARAEHKIMHKNKDFYRDFNPKMLAKDVVLKTAPALTEKEELPTTPSKKSYKNVRVTVVLLTWNRISALKKTLRSLSQQTFENFEVFVSNGNLKQSNAIDSYANLFKDSLKIRVSHDGNDLKAFRRFTVGKRLAEEGTDIVLFIDDDVEFDNTYVEQLLRLYEPKSYKSGFSWVFQDGGSDYYGKRRRLMDTKTIPSYCGTGMSIIDASIFLEDDLIKKAPDEALYIEDLWLSYFAQHVKKWKLGNIPLKNVVLGGADSVALYKEIQSNKESKNIPDKADFLRKLVKKYKWKV